MLKITSLSASLAETNEQILNQVDLQIKPGEIHVINGRNGSGKSTLAKVISGDPRFKVTGGDIILTVDSVEPHILTASKLEQANLYDLVDLEPHQRSLLGIFHANQYPLEIPGVNLENFLRLIYNTRKPKPLSPIRFRKMLHERTEIINYPTNLLQRNLNEGFSGGEKKKTEILQLAIIEPRLAILDETDSGLDKQAITEVFEGLTKIRQEILPNLSLIIITHYDKVFDYITPDFVHEMESGKLS